MAKILLASGKSLIDCEFEFIDLDNSKQYEIRPLSTEHQKRFWRTVENLDKMMKTNHPVRLIIPDRVLTDDEIEKLRSFYCREAKKIGINCVYFVTPVDINLL